LKGELNIKLEKKFIITSKNKIEQYLTSLAFYHVVLPPSAAIIAPLM
jgi:hypothetical protein